MRILCTDSGSPAIFSTERALAYTVHPLEANSSALRTLSDNVGSGQENKDRQAKADAPSRAASDKDDKWSHGRAL